jgi:hypothetical protein
VFFLFGLNSYHRTLGGVLETCRFCGRYAQQHVDERGTRLTVFFIPVWTFGRRLTRVCSQCGGQSPASRREAAALARR